MARTNQVNTIAGHLTAANLFGYQPEKQLPEPEKPLQSVAKLMAVYPAINDAAFAQTMDNYRRYVSEYNYRTQAENELICKHNAAVQIYKKETQLAKYQLQIIENFKRYNPLPAREYNAQVDAAGPEFGKLLEKRRIQTIKYSTEQIFANMLHLYNTQLMKRNSEYMRLSVRTSRPVQELEINSYFITQLKRNDIHSLDICSKTVRNHRQRLEEAGIFQNYTFGGHTMAVKVTINPEILAVFDIFSNRLVVAENQSLNSDCEKKLPDNNEITRTFKEKYKKSEAAAQASCDKVFPAVTPSDFTGTVFTGTQGSKEGISPGGAAPESVKTEKTLSEKLRDQILHPQELALQLAEGKFFNYIPIDVRLLYQEAYKGTLTRQEYRQLIIQDFFKNASKLYRESSAYPGSWKNALNEWLQNKWLTYNGVEFNKANIADDVTSLRWRLEQARRYFLRVGIQPRYPSRYFDLTRRTAKEGGFEYTKISWERHVKYEETLPAKKRKQERNAALRLEQINYSKKFENELRRFVKNKITLPQLYDYVGRNLPAEFTLKLPDALNRLLTQQNI